MALHCGASRRERMHVCAYARTMRARDEDASGSALQSRGEELVGLGLVSLASPTPLGHLYRPATCNTHYALRRLNASNVLRRLATSFSVR